MATKLPSGRYRAQVLVGTDASGKRCYESFVADTADEADYLALQFKLGKSKRIKTTLREACKQYIELKRPVLVPATIKNYEEYVERDFQKLMDKPLDSITSKDVQSEVATLLTIGNSPKTIKNKVSFISSVLREHEISIKVTIPRKPKEEYPVPSPEELRLIFAAIRGTEDEIPILLAAWLSLRRGEILGLRYCDVDYDGGAIFIRQAVGYVPGTKYVKAPKSSAGERKIPAPAYLLDLIKQREYAYAIENRNTLIFDGVGSNRFLVQMKAVCEKSGLPKYSFHSLRHANASIMAMLDIPEAYAMARGGWSSSQVMKNVYTSTFTSAERAVASKIDAYFDDLVSGDKS